MYRAVSRTNWFRVRDVAHLDAALAPLRPAIRLYRGDGDRLGRVMVTAEGHDEGEFPTCDCGGEPVDFGALLASEIADDEIVVLMSVGHDRIAELGGYAQALNARGERVELELSAIYELAAKAFGRMPTAAAH